MKRLLIVQLLVLLSMTLAKAQTRSDVCHVYVVDVAKATRAVTRYRESGGAEADAKAMAGSQTVFPEFHPQISEEELTTKTYRLPGSNLIVTASVYYTDESMKSVRGADSMIVAVAVAPRAQANALFAENNAVAEITYGDNMDTVRAKKLLKIKGRLFLVGIECVGKE